MKKFKAQKGITLVALIITIVVLLILAIVAIGVVKDSKIITHAQNARDSYTIGQEKEQIELALSEWKIEKVIPGNNPVFKTVIEGALNGQNVRVDGENDGPLYVTFNNTGNIYTITKDGEINEVEPGISITPTTITIALGETAQITAKTIGIEGTITYTSSNTNVATVSTEGLVTGQSEGETKITVSCGEYSATCSVTVTAAAVQGVKAFDLSMMAEGTIGILSPDSSKFAIFAPGLLLPYTAIEMDIPTIESRYGIKFGAEFVINENVNYKKILICEELSTFLALSEDGEKIYYPGEGYENVTIDGNGYLVADPSIDVSQYYNDSTDVEYYNVGGQGVWKLDYINKKIALYNADGTSFTNAIFRDVSDNDAPLDITVAGEPVTITTNAKKITYKVAEDRNEEYMYTENGKLYIKFILVGGDETNSGVVNGRELENAPELTKFINKAMLTTE